MVTPTPTRRRWLQFGIGTLFVVVTICCFLAAWLGHAAAVVREREVLLQPSSSFSSTRPNGPAPSRGGSLQCCLAIQRAPSIGTGSASTIGAMKTLSDCATPFLKQESRRIIPGRRTCRCPNIASTRPGYGGRGSQHRTLNALHAINADHTRRIEPQCPASASIDSSGLGIN